MRLALRLRLVAVVGLLVGLLAGTGLLVTPDSFARAQGNTTVDLSLRALGYSDQVATGATPSFDVFFPDLGSQPGDSQLIFIYSHADILLPDFSLVSVLVNNIPVYSARLDETNINRTTVTINIPADRFQVGANRVSFRFELRLRQECDGDTSPARNAIVYSDTTLRYGPPANPSPPDLRDFPNQFTSQTRPNAVIADRANVLKGKPTISVPLGVAVPPDATPVERNGAATLLLAVGASRPSLPVDPLALTTTDVINASRNENIIVVGRASSIATDLLQGAPFRIVNGAWQRVDNTPVPGDAGVLLMVPTPGDARGRVFLVSGNNDTGIGKAVAILNAGNTMNLLTGQGAVITDVTPTPPTPLAPTKYGLQDLGITGDAASVQGFGTHDIAASFIVPGITTNPATIQIDFASAPTLEPNLSTMTALINDQPFITQLLDGKNGERRLLTAQIPPNLFRPGRNTLRFAFALQGQGAVSCRTEFAGPAEFATLFPGTNLSLPTPSRDLSGLSLGLYPFPFATGSDPMTVIVNDLRDTDGLSAAYRLMLGTGGFTARGLTAQVLTAPEATPQALRGLNAVVIGFPSGNPVLDPVANQLFFVTGNGELRLRDTGGVQSVGGLTPAASPGAAGATGAAGGSTAVGTPGTSGTAVVSIPSIPVGMGMTTTSADIMGTPGAASAGGGVSQFMGGGTGPIGVLQILPAPWDNTRFMLVIAGGTVDLRALAVDALTRSRFAGREAVVSRDTQGQLVVGEARAVPQPTLAPPSATALATVIVQGGSGASTPAGGIIVTTPNAAGASNATGTPGGMGMMPAGTTTTTTTMAPTVSAGVATALAGGGAAATGTTGTTGTITSGPGTAPGGTTTTGTTTAAINPGGPLLATIPVSGTAPANAIGVANTPAAANTPTAVNTPAAATTPLAGATGPAGSATGVSAPAASGATAVVTRAVGTPTSATPSGAIIPPAVGAASSATPASSATIAGVTQVIGTRGAGTGTASPGAVSVLGNTATQTATAAAGATTGEKLFGLPRTFVFGVVAAAALALGIVIIALFLQGQRRAE